MICFHCVHPFKKLLNSTTRKVNMITLILLFGLKLYSTLCLQINEEVQVLTTSGPVIGQQIESIDRRF